MAKRKMTGEDYAKMGGGRTHRLTMFHAIIALAESGGFYGSTRSQSNALEQIIARCKREAAGCLVVYDEALAALFDREKS